MVDFTAGKFKSKVLYKVELYLLIGVEYDSRNTVMSVYPLKYLKN